jgi:urocanate hydratase
MNALGVSQCNDSRLYMYIGPQGIVHGTTITVLNAFRKINRSPSGGLFLLVAWVEPNPKQEILLVALRFVLRSMQRLHIRHSQGSTKLSKIVALASQQRNCIDRLPWECGWRLGEIWRKRYSYRFGKRPDLLHNPYAGGYYPTDISFEDANAMMAENPILFKERYRKHYAVTPPLSINKEPISLIMEMRSIRSFAQERI